MDENLPGGFKKQAPFTRLLGCVFNFQHNSVNGKDCIYQQNHLVDAIQIHTLCKNSVHIKVFFIFSAWKFLVGRC